MSCELAGNATSSEYILAESGTCYLSHETRADAVSVLLPASTTTAHLFHTQTSNPGIAARGASSGQDHRLAGNVSPLNRNGALLARHLWQLYHRSRRASLNFQSPLQDVRTPLMRICRPWTCTPRSVHLASHCLSCGSSFQSWAGAD